jgi:hypothetical protein
MKVKLHKNGWHAKLQQFVLGNRKPSFNSLCPYFWTTVFCLIVSPFTIIYKTVKFIFSKIWKGISFIFNKILDGVAWVIEYCITEPIEKFLVSKIPEKELINYAINFEPDLKRKYTGSGYTYSSYYYDLYKNKSIDSDKKEERGKKWEKYKKLQHEKAAKEGKVWDEKRFLELLDQKAGNVKMTLAEQAEHLYQEEKRIKREKREKEQAAELALMKRRAEEEERNRQREILAKQHQEEIRIQAQIKIAKRKKFNNRIIKVAKVFTPIILIIGGAGVLYFLYRMIDLVGPSIVSLFKTIANGIVFVATKVFYFLIDSSTWIGLGKLVMYAAILALGVITVFLFFKYTILGLKKIWPKFKFSVSSLDPTEYIKTKPDSTRVERTKQIDKIYKPIKVEPLKRIKRSIHNFLDFFKDYIKAAKKDYCPEIDWVNEDENDK